MSEQKPSGINTQVLIAAISGLVTVAVAVIGILPTFLNDDDSSAPVVVTATPPPSLLPAEISPLAPGQQPTQIQPTTEPAEPVQAAPTSTPTNAPPAQPAAVPDIQLIYDDVSFTVLNLGPAPVSLESIVFRSSSGQWEALNWGAGLYTSLPSGSCLRIRDQNAGQRQPPASCASLYGLQLVGASALFWLGTDSFDVTHNSVVIAACAAAAGTCAVALP